MYILKFDKPFNHSLSSCMNPGLIYLFVYLLWKLKSDEQINYIWRQVSASQVTYRKEKQCNFHLLSILFEVVVQLCLFEYDWVILRPKKINWLAQLDIILILASGKNILPNRFWFLGFHKTYHNEQLLEIRVIL